MSHGMAEADCPGNCMFAQGENSDQGLPRFLTWNEPWDIQTPAASPGEAAHSVAWSWSVLVLDQRQGRLRPSLVQTLALPSGLPSFRDVTAWRPDINNQVETAACNNVKMLSPLKFDSQFRSEINSLISPEPKLSIYGIWVSSKVLVSAKKKKSPFYMFTNIATPPILHHHNKIHDKLAYSIWDDWINCLTYKIPTHVCDSSLRCVAANHFMLMGQQDTSKWTLAASLAYMFLLQIMREGCYLNV